MAESSKNDFVEGSKILWRGAKESGKATKRAAKALSRASRNALKRAQDLRRESE